MGEWIWFRGRVSWRGHGLRQYLWDTRLARTTCRACTLGTGQILLRTWRWVWAAGTWEDRGWRATAPAGTIAGAVWAVGHYPTFAPSGILLAWLIAAGVLAPREVWMLPPEAGVEDAEPEPSEDAVEDPRVALLDLLDEVTRGRNGVHLEALAKHPALALPQAQLRPLLQAHGLPVVRSLSVDGVAGRSGVRRADVEALLKPLPQRAPEPPSEPTLSQVDLRKSQPVSAPLDPALSVVTAD